MKILPEPWASMSMEYAKQMKEPESRQMLAAVSVPALDQFRKDVPGMRTSELVAMLVRTDMIDARLLGDVTLETYTSQEEQVILAAALIAVGDEIDRRVPIP